MRIRSFLLLALASSLSSSCTVVLNDALRQPVSSCVGESDGTPCSAADICLDEVCVFSSCGDTFVDETTGETCDDGNLVAGDGCEPGRCRYSCARDAQCGSDDPCMESGGCDTTTHTCNQGVPSSGAACTRTDDSPGTCRVGLCASPNCGNGRVDEGEECDSDEPGCRSDCSWVCDEAAPCTTGDVCSMPVECDLASHVCTNLASPECDDSDACTAESCDPLTGCASTLIDLDGDGYAPYTCKPGSAHQGGDCDDTNPDRHPGAPEMLNGLDDDCDEEIDENPGVTCLRDADLDGFGDPNVTMLAPACTEGWVASRPRNDCHDGNAAVNPTVTAASATPYCLTGNLTGNASNGFGCSDGSTPKWDWNCDGNEAREVPAVLDSCANLTACGGSYWANSVPPCGTTGTLRSCANSCLLVLCSCNATDAPGVTARCL